MVSKKKQIVLYLLWCAVAPAIFYYAYTYYPPLNSHLFSVEFFLFLALLCLISYFPIMVMGIPIFLLQGVSLAIFLEFGLFVELVSSQIGLLTLLYRVKLSKDEWFRIPMNSIMLLVNSLASGLTYEWLGGGHENLDLLDIQVLSLIILHQLIWLGANYICLLLINGLIYGNKIEVVKKNQVVDMITAGIVFPIGLLMYSTYQEVGVVSIFILGIPLLSLTLTLRLYYEANRVNEDLQKASAIGYKLSSRLKKKEVLDLFLNEMNELFSPDEVYIFGTDLKQEQRLRMLRYKIKRERSYPLLDFVSPADSLVGDIWITKKSKVIHNTAALKKYKDHSMPDWVKSILVVPVIRDERVEGLILFISSKKNDFGKNQIMIAEILVSYLSSAMENAKHYEETKARTERCSLTKLYNHYYLEDYLDKQFMQVHQHKVEYVSLILIDLDHFKSINDTYGHLSGNEVLCQVAERLSSVVQYKGIAARYGGEEFVLVLPNANKNDAYEFAELVRQQIASNPYVIQSDLGHIQKELQVQMTASLGVATAPFDAEDSHTLLRHADRAMYTGAKRAGRNKVSQYIK